MSDFEKGDIVVRTEWRHCLWEVIDHHYDSNYSVLFVHLRFFGGSVIPPQWGKEHKCAERFIDLASRSYNEMEIIAMAAS